MRGLEGEKVSKGMNIEHRMNERQKQCFKMVYDFIHDERLQSQNLMAFIDCNFPEIDSKISKALHEDIKPYLELRKELGAASMELMYLLNQVITDEIIEDVG